MFFSAKMLCFKGIFMMVSAVTMVIIHIMSKSYVEEFRMSMAISRNSKHATSHDANIDRNLMELQLLAKIFDRYKTREIEMLNGRAKSFLKLPPLGGEFTPKSDEQIKCVSDKTVKVLVLLDSPYKDISKRMLIRESWKKQMLKVTQKHSLYWKLIFVVNQPDPSWQENQLFGVEVKSKRDMLVIQRPEMENQASIKLYSALRWALKSCSFEYLLFADTNHLIDMATVYRFVHSKKHRLSKNTFIGHKLSETTSITYNPIHQSESRIKTLQVLQDPIFLASKDVLQNTHNSMRWFSSFGKVHDSLKMVALALDEAQVKTLTHKQFVGGSTDDCQLGPIKSFFIRISNEKCYSDTF